MKKFIYAINVVLFATIMLLFRTTDIQTNKIKTDVEIKQISSSTFKQLENPNILVEEPTIEEEQEEAKSTISIDEPKDTAKKTVPVAEEKVIVEEKSEPVAAEPITDVLETMTGKMSGYGPNCSGCSGYTASGKYVGGGNITYYDPTYGNLRILAGDYSLKFGSIVRVKNSRAGTFTGIVLDRGGSIGIGKTFLFDLLYSSESEAIRDEVSYNVTFEILRYGY